MKHPAAPLLAERFGRLQHTNDRGETGIMHMPGFMAAGMSDEQMAESVGPVATGLAEAIIETLDTLGYTVASTDELDAQAREVAAQYTVDTGLDGVPIHCHRCRQVVISRLRLTRPEYIKIDVAAVVADLTKHLAECRP